MLKGEAVGEAVHDMVGDELGVVLELAGGDSPGDIVEVADGEPGGEVVGEEVEVGEEDGENFSGQLPSTE